jgi:hypothetical protein
LCGPWTGFGCCLVWILFDLDFDALGMPLEQICSGAFDGSLSQCVGGHVMGFWHWDLELGVAVAGFFYFSLVVGTEL